MVLTEPVFDLSGTLLLKAGVILSERRIRLLKSWGVVRVSVAARDLTPTMNDPLSSPPVGPETLWPSEPMPPAEASENGDLMMAEIQRVAGLLVSERQQLANTAKR
jgi:hypothetical protein